MLLVATLCDNRAEAMQILQDVPIGSIVLLPESINFFGKQLIPISKQKHLYVIYNHEQMIDSEMCACPSFTYIAKRIYIRI